jgi:hypothetical protein
MAWSASYCDFSLFLGMCRDSKQHYTAYYVVEDGKLNVSNEIGTLSAPCAVVPRRIKPSKCSRA